MPPLTTEEKIDYIYESLRKQERNAWIAFVFKWGFRIIILGYLYYFFTIGLPEMIGDMLPNFPEIPNFGLGESEETLSGTGNRQASLEDFQNYFNSYFQK